MSTTDSEIRYAWWKEALVYQIYPASFLDSNGDGWGDIAGIISKLDYLKDLGVDVMWLSPIFQSPRVDMGYDISDYTAIDPLYGTLEDVDLLISEMGKRRMKLMMDCVFNHTSDQHQWFMESRSSTTHPKRDYYIWKPPKLDEAGNRMPPNNWASILGGANSAWAWDEDTQEYYLALFTPAQPDLNWENPELRKEIYNIQRFWLDRGACGFRMDVINLISKHPDFPDAEVTAEGKYQSGFKFYANGPRMHEYLQEMNKEVLSQYSTMTVGEMPHIYDNEEILRTVGADAGELNMIFIFDVVDIDGDPKTGNAKCLYPWTAKDLGAIISKWQRIMFDRNGWNTVWCENHDTPRSLTRYCDDSDKYRELGAKLLALMLTTLGGTLFVFQGQELGLRNIPPEWDLDEYKDVGSISYWEKMNSLYPGDKAKLAEARKVLQRKARDNTRIPMQWTSEAPNAGFCPPDITPWMRVNDDYPSINAAAQIHPISETRSGSLSVREFWKRRLADRKANKELFVYGDFGLIGKADDDTILAYKRFSNAEAAIVVLNFSGERVEWEVPEDVRVRAWETGNYATGLQEVPNRGRILLRPWEALLGRFDR
ncbi:glycoside hydrolase family 13 protein [Melanomma pulvis-pyrius CBS 109.77]|uniref:Glycoside hydrolase family 13 protein n=1 Tax=Melanomma pulvis-pyrius CBS 109.77 TaxID=1314802 RepID=A0A6A6WP92_9PLEO|nr:glycoside hydrolase family 13 protein [Melanomma pulvis-pyrius CBS 109.77]